MLLLLAAAHAADTTATFVPWTGASLTATSGSATVAASIASAVGPHGVLAVDAAFPASVASGTTAGAWTAGFSLTTSNAGDLPKAALDTVIPSGDLHMVRGEFQMAWCQVVGVQKASGQPPSADEVAAALVATAGKVQPLLDAATAARGERYVPAAGCPSFLPLGKKVGDDPEADRVRKETFEDVIAFLGHVPGLLAQARLVAADGSATPFDELAKRQLDIVMWKVGPRGEYAGTIATSGDAEVPFLSENTFDVGVTAQLYEAAGFAQALDVGWAPTTLTSAPGEATDVALDRYFVQGGLGWASPVLFHAEAKATTTDPLGYYVAVQAVSRVDLGAETAFAGSLMVALRPTASGLGIAAGPTLAWNATDGTTVGPAISFSGELPNLAGR